MAASLVRSLAEQGAKWHKMTGPFADWKKFVKNLKRSQKDMDSWKEQAKEEWKKRANAFKKQTKKNFQPWKHYHKKITTTPGPTTTGEPTTTGAPPQVLLCEDAEPQAPRDLTPTCLGELEARVRPLDGDATPRFIQANLHFHLGAEHKSNITNGYYKTFQEVGLQEPLVRPSEDIRPGFFCGLDDVPSSGLEDFNFQFCKNVSVGYTYEFHWVFSTGAPLTGLRDEGDEGQLGITDGLGGALARTINPRIIVRGQICRIINNQSLVDVEADYNNLVNQWRQPPLGQGVRYIGSTTGTAFNNEVCSPLEVNWHVDTECCTLYAQTFDRPFACKRGTGLAWELRVTES